jgi:hypothetical protein
MDQVGELMSVVAGFEKFVLEMLGDPAFAPSAVEINDALQRLDCEADFNPDATQMLKCLEIIASKSTPIAERLEEMHKLTSLRGKVVVEVHGWTGWR